MQCPKCQYVTTAEEDQASPGKCPKCEIYYEKYLARKAELDAKRRELAEKQQLLEKKKAAAAAKAETQNAQENRPKPDQTAHRMALQAAKKELSSLRGRPAAPQQEVVIVDIQMKFTSMVEFMVKWTIATIPAIAILVLFAYGIAQLFKTLLF